MDERKPKNNQECKIKTCEMVEEKRETPNQTLVATHPPPSSSWFKGRREERRTVTFLQHWPYHSLPTSKD